MVADDVVQKVVNVASWVVVHVLADQDDPGRVLVRVKGDDGTPPRTQMPDAEPVQVLSGNAVVQCLAALAGQLVAEALEGAAVRSAQGGDLRLGDASGANLDGHLCGRGPTWNENAPIAAPHLCEALLKITAVEQRRVRQPAVDPVEQATGLAGSPQLAHDVPYPVDVLSVEEQSRCLADAHQNAFLAPRAHSFFAQLKKARGDDRPYGTKILERVPSHAHEPLPTVIVFGQSCGDVLKFFDSVKDLANLPLLR